MLERLIPFKKRQEKSDFAEQSGSGKELSQEGKMMNLVYKCVKKHDELFSELLAKKDGLMMIAVTEEDKGKQAADVVDFYESIDKAVFEMNDVISKTSGSGSPKIGTKREELIDLRRKFEDLGKYKFAA